MKIIIQAFILILVLISISCDKENEINTLRISKEKIEITPEGGSYSFTIETNSESWNIENIASHWIDIPINNESLITVKIDSKTITPRTDTLKVSADNTKPVSIIISQASSEYLYNLGTSKINLDFGFESASVTINNTSGAPEWNLICDADWLQLSRYNGAEDPFSIKISTSKNYETVICSSKIILNGEYAPTSIIKITQYGGYPNYNTNLIEPNMTGISNSTMEIDCKIKIGWNIGNTMETIRGETA